jgi:hypothetical protein
MYEVKLTLENGEELVRKFDTFEVMLSFIVENEKETTTMEITANGVKCE